MYSYLEKDGTFPELRLINFFFFVILWGRGEWLKAVAQNDHQIDEDLGFNKRLKVK